MALRSHDLVRRREAVVYRFPGSRRGNGPAEADAGRRPAPGLLAAAAAAALVGLLWWGAEPKQFAAGSRPGSPARVVVEPGDTLWGLSQRYAPLGVEWRAYADAIVELNDLRRPLQAGERIRLPR